MQESFYVSPYSNGGLCFEIMSLCIFIEQHISFEISYFWVIFNVVLVSYDHSRDRRKWVKKPSETKSEENRPPLKFNFKGGLFSSILLSEASLMHFRQSRQFPFQIKSKYFHNNLFCLQKNTINQISASFSLVTLPFPLFGCDFLSSAIDRRRFYL